MSDFDQEDEALGHLLSHLRSVGHAAELICRPDRLPHVDRRGLTVDAVALVDGELWAIDVLRSMSIGSEVASRVEWKRTVLPMLEEAARDAGVTCEVQARPPYEMQLQNQKQPVSLWSPKARPVFLTSARRTMRDCLHEPGQRIAETNIIIKTCTLARVDREGCINPRVRCTRYFRTDPTIPLNKVVERETGATIARKLSGQLKRAKDLGYSVGVLMDPRDDAVNWIAHPDLFCTAIRTCLVSGETRLDAAWLITIGGRIIDLLHEK